MGFWSGISLRMLTVLEYTHCHLHILGSRLCVIVSLVLFLHQWVFFLPIITSFLVGCVGHMCVLINADLKMVYVFTALARFAFGHNKHLKSIAAAYWKPHCNSLLSSLPSLAHIRSSGTAYTNSNQHMPHGSIVSSQIGPLLRFGNENSTLVRDGRVSTSSPLANTGMMHGSPLSDDSSQHSDSGVLHEETVSNGTVNHSRPKPLNNALYSQCVLTMCTLANDPSPRIATLGRRVLSIIGIEQVVTKPVKPSSSGIKPTDGTAASQPPSFAGLARSSSWFDMNGGMLIFFWLGIIYHCCAIFRNLQSSVH